MVKGIGVDSVDIAEMGRLCAYAHDVFVLHTFTEREREQAFASATPADRFAGMFAAKEATFKALAHLTSEGFDFRGVETLEDENGCPHVSLTGAIEPVLAETGVTEVLVSITNESGLATAFVVAQ